MAGIYLHIPFCKQACHYCNFHFSTSLKYKEEMLEAILKEIELQKDYLKGESLKSIYFGGGTPSLLSTREIQELLDQISRFHQIEDNAEITLEANPDDLSQRKLQELAQTPINRLSIGIQSFAEVDLEFMNRAHNAEEAEQCLTNAKNIGFDNLTIDLIYGGQTTTDDVWAANVEKALQFDIPHLSCYALTVEPQTALDHFVTSGKASPVDEEKASAQFIYLMDKLEKAGYDHYEISNFAKPDQYARHNTNYWLGTPYLGMGPSAHSYSGNSRQWNIAHNAKYLKALAQNDLPFESEVLTLSQQYNEYVLTRLRTIWGCEATDIQHFGAKYWTYFQEQIKPFIEQQQVIKKANQYVLTRSGKLLADYISMELFWSE
ncbi:MAG: radical SAM family heme chaperone HemW [Bacteroidota bacterium]